MESETSTRKRKMPLKKVLIRVVAVVILAASIAGVYIYRNFNQLLSDALIRSFNSSLISDVYELKFDKLRVNFALGNIRIINVVFQPRLVPLHNYPYINSSIKLSAHKILLTNVQIMDLLKRNKLQLDDIEIAEPVVELHIQDNIPILFPFRDTTAAKVEKGGKQPIESYGLKKFDLTKASIRVINTAKQRQFDVNEFNISIRDILIRQNPGQDIISYNHIDLSIGEFAGKMKNEAVKYLSFKDYSLTMDSLEMQKSPDTLIYRFADFSTGIKMVDVQTADSTFHVSLQSFSLGYRDKVVQLAGFSFKPNVSNAVLQAKSRYQKTEFSGTLGALNITGLDFDSLIYYRKILIDEISIDKLDLSLFKDKSKPVDRKKFPEYLGQKIKAIPVPLTVKHVKATNVNLVNVERKEDGKTAKVIVGRGTLEAKNITNIPTADMLTMNASAYIENKVLLKLDVAYSYDKPQFNINIRAGKFNLLDLNQLLLAYTPAKIGKGMVDEISLSGTAYRTNAIGTMKFLYHDLDVDLKLSEKKWQNDVVAFAANTYLSTNNPPSAGIPPKVVNYKVDRDMNKGGFNIILKSFLSGMKETMIMSKENKKAYKEEKKKWKLKKK